MVDWQKDLGPILESKGTGAIFQKKGKYLKIWVKFYKIWIYSEKGQVIACNNRMQQTAWIGLETITGTENLQNVMIRISNTSLVESRGASGNIALQWSSHCSSIIVVALLSKLECFKFKPFWDWTLLWGSQEESSVQGY